MTTPLLQVSDLHAGYGRAEVLTGLAFELPKGQVVTVIGPNGAAVASVEAGHFEQVAGHQCSVPR